MGREGLLLKYYMVKIKTLLGEEKVVYSQLPTQFQSSTRNHSHKSRRGAV
jgi:hypothetical protein